MGNINKYTLDAFKTALNNDEGLKRRLLDRNDVIEDSRYVIHRCNISKYLEKYLCKDEDDLSDTLYYHYGIFLVVVD